MQLADAAAKGGATTAGGAGAAGQGGSGGHANAPAGDAGVPGQASTGIASGAALGVELRVDGKAQARVALTCLMSCVDVEVHVTGGTPPYQYEWSDGALSGGGRVQLCPMATTDYRVTVTDSGFDDQDREFGHGAMQAEASITVEHIACDDTPLPTCTERAAADSFDPVVRWQWDDGWSQVTPLVANLTDDNADGVIDVRDTPDVVFVGWTAAVGTLYVLDGATGSEHFHVEEIVDGTTPAIADMDGDHVPDIIVLESFGRNDGKRRIGVLDHNGEAMWAGDTPFLDEDMSNVPSALAVADLDHDGSPEILAASSVFDSHAKRMWSAKEAMSTDSHEYTSPIAVDLDGDQNLEVIWGSVAYRFDGTPYYVNDDIVKNSNQFPLSVFSAVADLDADGVPEVIVTTLNSVYVLDNHGQMLQSKYIPANQPGASTHWAAPPAVHDFDGDGKPDILASNGIMLFALRADLTELWSMPVHDISGDAGGTAFDFLGDGSAEPMFADEQTFWMLGGSDAQVLFQRPRASATLIEYASVADVDNDGSADILLPSSVPDAMGSDHGVAMISDRNRRWIPARRIMNQDSYHVTNVEEDGTIPRFEAPHYLRNNTFRAQAQIDASGVCVPKPVK
jgi:hypothetical protein